MRPIDAVRLATLGAIWGSSFYFIKLALDNDAYSSIQIVGARLALGALTLLALLYASGKRLPRDRKTWKLLAGMAIIANVIPFYFITLGTERIDSGLAAILNATTPLFTALVSAVALKNERFSPLRTLGMLIGFAGVGVIVGAGGGN